MRKLIGFVYSLLPMFFLTAIQVVVVAGFTLAGGRLEEGDCLSLVSVLINTIFLIPAGFWYRNLGRGEDRGARGYGNFSGREWFRVSLLGIAVQLGTGVFLMLFGVFFPKQMEAYGKVMESLGMFAPTFWSVLYTVVLAPLAEELLYRGLILKILEKSFPFWAANLIQAFYFGVMHGNLVQGTYAFFNGILCGILVRKYGTLKASVFFHFIVNLSGAVLGIVPLGIWQRIWMCVTLLAAAAAVKDKRIGQNE